MNKKPHLMYSIIISLLFIALGIYILFHYTIAYFIIRTTGSFIILISGIMDIISLFVGKIKPKHNFIHFISPFVLIIVAILLYLTPYWFWGIIPILIGIWSIINAIVSAIKLYIYKKDGVKGWYFQVVSLLLFSVLGFLLVVNPIWSMHLSGTLIGLYILLFGATLFRDSLFFILEIRKNNIKRHFRVVLPVFISAFIPNKVLNKINNVLSKTSDKERNKLKKFFSKGIEIKKLYSKDKLDSNNIDEETEKETRLELFIHLAKDVAMGFGHCDVCFDDTVISYGCYDQSSNRGFGMVSDGVMAMIPRKEYISYCLKQEKKILVGFKINITKKQAENVLNQIKILINSTLRWYCKYEVEKQKNKDYKNTCTDPASLLRKDTNAVFYKFKNGKFKTYFVLGNNCVRVVDFIVGVSGIDAMGNGIITPGTYYSYLNNSYKNNEGIVISEHIYLDPSNNLSKIQKK